jgi:hypothetical protein
MDIQVGNVGYIIQVPITPVFLSTGVGTKLAVLTNRLARIIDPSRVLEDRLDQVPTQEESRAAAEPEMLYRRAHLINRAITLSTSCGLLTCVVIAALFTGDALNLELDKLIATLFVPAVLALIGSFVFLLQEIFVATRRLPRRQLVIPEKSA